MEASLAAAVATLAGCLATDAAEHESSVGVATGGLASKSRVLSFSLLNSRGSALHENLRSSTGIVTGDVIGAVEQVLVWYC